ncbi:MAG: hypothetical protein IJH81_06415 [Lachnospiraceae bacterium]|nr:hypothetical protein [Lachnospiraceae bacterium]
MLVALALILWLVDVVFHTIYYKKLANRIGNSFNLYGMVTAMVSSGLLTYLMGAGSKHSSGYVTTVNGVTLSPDVHFTLAGFMTWVFVGAIMNLAAMGIGYLLTQKDRNR